MGQKNDDREAFPLCRQHHIYERHALQGYFSGWSKSRIKEWESEQVDKSRRVYLGLGQSDTLDF